jgi:hypothetical protein
MNCNIDIGIDALSLPIHDNNNDDNNDNVLFSRAARQWD